MPELNLRSSRTSRGRRSVLNISENQTSYSFRPEPPAEPEDPKKSDTVKSERPAARPELKTTRTLEESRMFSALSSSRVTAACVVAMVMMMMMMTAAEAAAMLRGGGQSKSSVKPHKKSSDGVEVEMVPLQIDPSLLFPSTSMRPLENASISPWTYNISHDDSVYPPQLAEAHCLLRGCLTREGQEDQNLESRPIKRQVLVLRRVGSAEVGSEAEPSYHFRLETRFIAVGCTCVRTIIREQN